MNSANEKGSEETTSNSSLFTSATQDELFVSQILLGLENLTPFSRFIWGCRKRRSCRDAAPSSPPSVQIAEEEIELVEAGKATSSPASPLSFSPSESDGKSKRSSKKILKKTSRAAFINKIEELSKHGDLLRVKVENVRKQLNELKTHNSDLKTMKREALKTRQSKEEPQRAMCRFLNLGMDFIQHQHPFVADRTAHKLHHPFGPIIRTQMYPPNNGLPDLNLTAEEAFGVDSTQPLDVNPEISDKRARFAEARRMRKGIIKIKSMRSACGIKLARP